MNLYYVSYYVSDNLMQVGGDNGCAYIVHSNPAYAKEYLQSNGRYSNKTYLVTSIAVIGNSDRCTPCILGEWFAEKGEQGEKGEKGDTGSQGIMGPQGPQGERGVQGEQGIVGPQGERGYRGDIGPQGLRGPQGEKGDAGKSAYEIWLELGNEGTIYDFADASKGAGLKSIQQVYETHESSGVNIIRFNVTDGSKVDAKITNGEKGEKGDKGDTYQLTADDKVEISNSVESSLASWESSITQSAVTSQQSAEEAAQSLDTISTIINTLKGSNNIDAATLLQVAAMQAAVDNMSPTYYYETYWDSLTDAQKNTILIEHSNVVILEGSAPISSVSSIVSINDDATELTLTNVTINGDTTILTIGGELELDSTQTILTIK